MKKMKKALAIALSAAMVMGMSMTSFAADQEVSVDAPIYAYDITNVVVPTTFVVAFNPDKLNVDVKGDGTEITRDQIVSKNYGIINKSTKDKLITVTLNVEDLNDNKIIFTGNSGNPGNPGMPGNPGNPGGATNTSADAYELNLTVVPADNTEVKVGGASAGLATTGADLADVTMTKATGKDQPLMAGENEVGFLLEKAEYDGTINLNSATENNVADAFELKGLAADGKGITAFTFGGSMNENADWTKLTKGIRITAVYSNENVPDGAQAETGTGALYNNPNPVFKTGAGVGTIKYKPGTGTDAVRTITSIEIDYDGVMYDGYNGASGAWEHASDEGGLITFDPAYFDPFISGYPNDATREAWITYQTAGNMTRTVVVDVRLKAQVGPTFTTGSDIGFINYTTGSGDEALASITKIEIDYEGTMYDGYNAATWNAATDSNGLIILDPTYFDPYITQYPSDATREAVITYVTASGKTKTATVDVKLR